MSPLSLGREGLGREGLSLALSIGVFAGAPQTPAPVPLREEAARGELASA